MHQLRMREPPTWGIGVPYQILDRLPYQHSSSGDEVLGAWTKDIWRQLENVRTARASPRTARWCSLSPARR